MRFYLLSTDLSKKQIREMLDALIIISCKERHSNATMKVFFVVFPHVYCGLKFMGLFKRCNGFLQLSTA